VNLPFSQSLKFLRYHKRESLLFLIGLFLGLSVLGVVHDLRVSFQEGLNSKSKELLGSDLSLSSRVEISPEKIAKVDHYLKDLLIEKIQLDSFFSMAKGEKTRLVWVKVLSEGFPFYGRYKLKSENLSLIPKPGRVWIYPELVTLLGVEVGDKIKLGGKDYLIEDIVLDDPSQGLSWGSVAPRVFFNNQDLVLSGLVQKGATKTTTVFYKLKNPISDDEVNVLEELIDDSAVEVTTPLKTSQQMARAMKYLSDFLSLISLVALFMAGSGLYYLFGHLLEKAKTSFYLFRLLGLNKKQIGLILINVVLILSFLGSLLAFSGTAILLPTLKAFLAEKLKADFPTAITSEIYLFFFGLGPLFALCMTWPTIYKSLSESIPNLFEEVYKRASKSISTLHFLPGILLFLLLSLLSSKSFKIGTFFFVSMFISSSLYWLVFNFTFKKIGLLKGDQLWLTLLSKSIGRQYKTLITGPVTLAIAAMMLNLIPQMQLMIEQELSFDPQSSSRPHLFMFDIQDEQVDPFNQFLISNDLVADRISPMIRGRLTKINDKPLLVRSQATLTREQERSERMKNRGVNITYKVKLNPDEQLIEGEDFRPPYNSQNVQISLEKNYAERIGAQINDILEFDILGIPISGKVVNFRKVKWSSMNPNFFITFSPGVLEDAPKTHLMTINKLENAKKLDVLEKMTEAFPNVSAVDISNVVEKVLNVFSQMMKALRFQTLTTLLCGLFVVFSMGLNQAEQRRTETSLYLMLGVPRKSLIIWSLIEASVINSIASFMGVLVSFGLTSLVVIFFFDFDVQINLGLGLIVALSVTLLSTLITFISQWRRLFVPPLELLS